MADCEMPDWGFASCTDGCTANAVTTTINTRSSDVNHLFCVQPEPAKKANSTEINAIARTYSANVDPRRMYFQVSLSLCSHFSRHVSLHVCAKSTSRTSWTRMKSVAPMSAM